MHHPEAALQLSLRRHNAKPNRRDPWISIRLTTPYDQEDDCLLPVVLGAFKILVRLITLTDLGHPSTPVPEAVGHHQEGDSIMIHGLAVSLLGGLQLSRLGDKREYPDDSVTIYSICIHL